MNQMDIRRPSRRTALKWMMTLIATPTIASCGSSDGERQAIQDLGIALDVEGAGYGHDPDLMDPIVPWRRTLTKAQLNLVASLADVFIPSDDASPAASVGDVAGFVDEWVSAPYPQQSEDRDVILRGLEDVEGKAYRRYSKRFVDLDVHQKNDIVDDLLPFTNFLPAYVNTSGFFARFRYLTLSAYYMSEEGQQDIGYIGNAPVLGPYPGPSKEALAHLQSVLDNLGLKMPKEASSGPSQPTLRPKTQT